jgi:hypothetical protein
MKILKSGAWFCVKWLLLLAWAGISGSIAQELFGHETPWWAWSLIMSTVTAGAFASTRGKVFNALIVGLDERFDRLETLIQKADPIKKEEDSERRRQLAEDAADKVLGDPAPPEDPTPEWNLKCEHCSRPMRHGATKCGYCWRERNPL